MDKFEKCAVIKYLFLKGMSGKAIYDDILTTLGDSAPVYSIVKSWLPSSNVGETVSRMSSCCIWPSYGARPTMHCQWG